MRKSARRVPPGVCRELCVRETAERVAKHTSTTDRQVFAQGSQQSVRAFKLSYDSMKIGCVIASVLRPLAPPNARPSVVLSDAYAGAQTTRTVPTTAAIVKAAPASLPAGQN